MDTPGFLLSQQLHSLNPSAIVELFEIDARPAGDDSVLTIHNGTQGLTVAATFLGITYSPMPIEIKGFELSTTGEPPRPSMKMSNLMGLMSALVLKTRDLVGAKVTRRRTFARFLDGMPDAAPVMLSEDVFFIERKVSEDHRMIEFELGSSLDLDGVMYPIRTVSSGYCGAQYRGLGCEFSRSLAVANSQHKLFAGAKNFCGTYSSTRTYQPNDSAQYTTGGFLRTYLCIDAAPIIGVLPTVTASWKEVQRYRGNYDPTVTDYVLNDVVLRELNGTKVVAIVIWSGAGVPIGQPPPNAIFWETDACAKFLVACKDRYDPKRANEVLRFNGFPGTVSMPEQ